MKALEQFKNLSMEEKTEIINSYLQEDKNAEDTTIVQYMFFKCVDICVQTNSENFWLESYLKKIGKTAKMHFELQDWNTEDK